MHEQHTTLVHSTVVQLSLISVLFEISSLSSGDWIEFNSDRIGYYRVNYDENLWNLMANQLKEDHTVEMTL